ncbi:MAG: OmpA family protein [Deltaproteobacteria bacterium]|nr:OmpA family protein [Deltaproteobacteria bacterium]
MMRKFVVALFVVSMSVSVGCKKQPPPTPTPAPAPAPILEAPAPPPAPPPVVVQPRALERVQFHFDSTAVTGGTTQAITHNAEILQEFPSTRVEVQGHADERGTTEYNLALGQRRAEEVKERVSRMGVSSSRLQTISYGEERPMARTSSEDAWAQNRRAEFRVLASGQNEPVEGTVP